MIYKKISYTLSLFILMIKAFSVPVGDNLLSDSDDEFTDLVDNFDLTEDIKEVDIFSDDDSIITDIINPEDNTEVYVFFIIYNFKIFKKNYIKNIILLLYINVINLIILL